MVSYLGNGITFPTAYAGGIKASGIAFPVIGLVLLLCRALINISKNVEFGLAEFFAIFSWLNVLGMGVVFVWSASNGGLGHPTPTNGPVLTATYISPVEKNITMAEYIFLILLVVALGTTKLSLIFFFRKIIAIAHRNIWNHVSTILIVIVSVWTVAYTLAFILVCGDDPSAFWSPLEIRKKCLQVTAGYAILEKSCYISDLILDVACIVLPFPVLMGLHLQLRQKITVAGVFMVGIMTILAGIVRLVVWIQILNTASDRKEDVNLGVTLALQWGMIEAGLAFIVSQLPALGAYLNKSSREDVAHTIKYAASVISIKSTDSRSSRNHSKSTSRDCDVIELVEQGPAPGERQKW